MKQKRAYVPLHEQAEKVLASSHEIGEKDRRPKHELIHDLEVHQIKLEMQNEELRRTQARLEEISSKYFDLYNLAPAGYFIFDEEWTILEANLTGTRMLGTTKSQIIKKPLHVYIHPEFQDTFHLYRRKLLQSRNPETCELKLRNNVFVSIESIPVLDEQGAKTGKIRSVFTDITEKKTIEASFIKELELKVEERTKELKKEIIERTRAEEKLQAKEAELELIANATPVILTRLSRDLRYVFVNRACAELLGLSVEEIIGRPVVEIIGKEACERIRPYIESVLRGERVTYEREIPYKRAGTRFMQVEYIPERSAQGEVVGWLASILDITDRKRTEEALSESEEKYRRIVETANEGIWMIDVEGRTIFVNKKMAEMLGYIPEEILGKNSLEFVAEEDIETVRHKIEERKGKEDSYEVKLVKKDGTNLWMLANAVPVYNKKGEFIAAFGMFTDVTERKQADEALRKAKDELEDKVRERTSELQSTSLYARSLIEASLDPLVTISTEGKITDVNHATEEVTGVARRQLIGSDFSDYFTEPGMARAGYKKVFREGFVRDYPLELKHRDGHVTPVLYNASVYRDEAGQIKGVFAAARDITRRKKMEEEMLAANSKLRAMTSEIIKTEERERQRIATVLHDSIAQTLGAAKMRLELLGEYISSDGRETQREALDLTSESIRQTRSIMAELSPPILNELGFVPALEWLSKQIENQHGLRVDFRGNGQLKPLNHDLEVLLFQGTRELLTNVVKHAKAKKAVVTISEKNRNLQIDIKDNGIGFQKEGSDLKSDLTGGFGLFNIRERLNHFGGELTIRSGRKGSHVIITVPIQ